MKVHASGFIGRFSPATAILIAIQLQGCSRSSENLFQPLPEVTLPIVAQPSEEQVTKGWENLGVSAELNGLLSPSANEMIYLGNSHLSENCDYRIKASGISATRTTLQGKDVFLYPQTVTLSESGLVSVFENRVFGSSLQYASELQLTVLSEKESGLFLLKFAQAKIINKDRVPAGGNLDLIQISLKAGVVTVQLQRNCLAKEDSGDRWFSVSDWMNLRASSIAVIAHCDIPHVHCTRGAGGETDAVAQERKEGRYYRSVQTGRTSPIDLFNTSYETKGLDVGALLEKIEKCDLRFVLKSTSGESYLYPRSWTWKDQSQYTEMLPTERHLNFMMEFPANSLVSGFQVSEVYLNFFVGMSSTGLRLGRVALGFHISDTTQKYVSVDQAKVLRTLFADKLKMEARCQ